MPLCAAPCRCSQGRRRKYALLLMSGSVFEPEGRGLRATLRVAKPSQPKAAREALPARHRFRVVTRFRNVALRCWSRIEPFGATEFGEREVCFSPAHRVGVDSKSQRMQP
jgi:hypothetical protein